MTGAVLAALLLEWVAKLAHSGQGFATELAGTRLSRLVLRVCALVVIAGTFTTAMLSQGEQYLLERRIVVAAIFAACAGGVSIAMTFRRRRRDGSGPELRRPAVLVSCAMGVIVVKNSHRQRCGLVTDAEASTTETTTLL